MSVLGLGKGKVRCDVFLGLLWTICVHAWGIHTRGLDWLVSNTSRKRVKERDTCGSRRKATDSKSHSGGTSSPWGALRHVRFPVTLHPVTCDVIFLVHFGSLAHFDLALSLSPSQ